MRSASGPLPALAGRWASMRLGTGWAALSSCQLTNVRVQPSAVVTVLLAGEAAKRWPPTAVA